MFFDKFEKYFSINIIRDCLDELWFWAIFEQLNQCSFWRHQSDFLSLSRHFVDPIKKRWSLFDENKFCSRNDFFTRKLDIVHRISICQLGGEMVSVVDI